MTVCNRITFIIIINIIISHVANAKIVPRSYSVDSNIKNIPINTSQVLVVEQIGCKLTLLDLNVTGNHVSLDINEVSRRHCSFDLYDKNTVFYNYDYSFIKSTSTDYPKLNLPVNYQFSTTTEPEFKYSVAVDFISKKIYATSWDDIVESVKLIVIDIQNNNFGIVFTNLKSPKYLVLDPSEGLMFIGQLSSILRSNMDGTMLQKIVEKNGISELAIDRQSKRIYWANLVSIESSNYEGRDRRVITTITNPLNGLTVLNNQLFWLTPPHGMNPKTSIWTCRISDTGICGVSSQIQFNGEPKLIRAYDFDEQQATSESKKNPCEINNGGCQHLCLLTDNKTKTHSCACNLGYYLNKDSQNCSLATDEFLLYMEENFSKNYFKGRILDLDRTKANISTAFIDTIYPNRFEVSFPSRTAFNFDYDFNENLVFYNKDIIGRIDAKILLPNKASDSIALGDGIPYFAVDWVSKNLYYAYNTRSGRAYIRVTSYSRNKNYMESDSLGTMEIRSMVVHPNLGYIYFIGVDSTAKTSSIYRLKTDLSWWTVEPINKNHYVNEVGLAIDYEEDRLYWFSADNKKLEYIKLDGSEDVITSIDVSIVKNPRTISIYQQWAYVSNFTSIWRLNKLTGNNAVKLIDANLADGPGKVDGARIYARGSQPLVDNHPCAVGNGGCQVFCFAVPSKSGNKLNRQCGCLKGQELQLDQVTCKAKNSKMYFREKLLQY